MVCLSLLMSAVVLNDMQLFKILQYLPVAEPSVLVTCTVISIFNALLNISTGCTGPASSLTLYVDCSKLTTITETKNNYFSLLYVEGCVLIYFHMYTGYPNCASDDLVSHTCK